MKIGKKLRTAVALSLVMGGVHLFGYGVANADSIYGADGTGGSKTTTVEAEAYAHPSNNNFTVDSDVSYVCGGYANNGSSSNNRVVIENGVNTSQVYGGHAYYGNSNDNTVILKGVATYEVIGGYTDYALSTGVSTEANGNTVMVLNGISSSVYGGRNDTGTGHANNNTVILSGEVTSTIYGGYCGSGEKGQTQNNIVNIGGYIDTEGLHKLNNVTGTAKLYGGYANDFTGNTLNVFQAGNTVSSIDKFEKMNFYITDDVANGDKMLTVTNAVDLTGVTSIKAGVETGSKLEAGNKVNLIHSDNGISNFTASTGKVSESDYVEFDLEIKQDAPGDTDVYAEITKAPEGGTASGGSLTLESKSPVETQAASMTMLNAGGDMLANAGFANAAQAISADVAQGANGSEHSLFAAVGGNKSKVKSGSHVDVKGWNMNLGFAKEVENKAGKLMFGPVVEYGRGNYDSYLDNGYHGEGDTKYIGGGLIAKQSNNNGCYYEGSVRAGKLSNDYKAGVNHYDSDSAYLAAHVGLGKVVKLGAKNSLDYYGKYFYTHQFSDNTTLHAGGVDYDLHFDGVDSNRTRLGARFNHDFDAKNSAYIGMAWQHEFSGSARATIDGAGTPAPTIKGNTGIVELGWKVEASKKFDLDLGATGYTGKQKGASVNLNMNFKF